MNTQARSSKRFIRRLHEIITCLAMLSAIGALTSCGTSPAGKPLSDPLAMNSGHWYKARSHPPTYFPKGFPASHPTTDQDGFWVKTGDAEGSRYFVPDDRRDGKALHDEALSMRSEELLRECAEDERRAQIRKTQNYAMLIPLNLIFAIGQTGISEEDFDSLRTDWFE